MSVNVSLLDGGPLTSYQTALDVAMHHSRGFSQPLRPYPFQPQVNNVIYDEPKSFETDVPATPARLALFINMLVLIFSIIALASPDWYALSAGGTSSVRMSIGLWKYCADELGCQKYCTYAEDGPLTITCSRMNGLRAMMLLVVFFCTFVGVAAVRHAFGGETTERQRRLVVVLQSIVCAWLLSGLCIGFEVKADGQGFDYSYCYWLTLAAVVLEIFSVSVGVHFARKEA